MYTVIYTVRNNLFLEDSCVIARFWAGCCSCLAAEAPFGQRRKENNPSFDYFTCLIKTSLKIIELSDFLSAR